MASDDDIVTKHPSFGQILANRVSSSASLPFYGSKIKHGHFIQIEIKESEMIRSLNEDRYHDGRQIVQIRMTENQWAQFVSSLNVGGGTPCTIVRREVNGKLSSIADPPFTDERRTIQNEFEAKAKEVVADLQETLKTLQALTAPGAKVSKAELLRVQNGVEKAVREVALNMPFVVDQFEETMDHVVTSARADIEAHLMNALQRGRALGLSDAEANVGIQMIEEGKK